MVGVTYSGLILLSVILIAQSQSSALNNLTGCIYVVGCLGLQILLVVYVVQKISENQRKRREAETIHAPTVPNVRPANSPAEKKNSNNQLPSTMAEGNTIPAVPKVKPMDAPIEDHRKEDPAAGSNRPEIDPAVILRDGPKLNLPEAQPSGNTAASDASLEKGTTSPQTPGQSNTYLEPKTAPSEPSFFEDDEDAKDKI